jgi:hypothetical protein
MAEEDDFRAFYTGWLWRRRLPHGARARGAVAAEHAALCGRDVGAFLRGYQEFRLRRGVPDSAAAFVTFCAPLWVPSLPAQPAADDAVEPTGTTPGTPGPASGVSGG